MQMEDAGRDKMDALRVEGEDDSEEKEEEEVPENGHGATKDVEAPVDNGGHGVCGKIAEVLGYLIENGTALLRGSCSRKARCVCWRNVQLRNCVHSSGS